MTAQGVATAQWIKLDQPDDFSAWRDAARRLVADGVTPDRVVWSGQAEQSADFFASMGHAAPAPAAIPRPVRANSAFLRVAQNAVLHSDPARHALLYRTLWRLQDDRQLMDNPVDPDVRRLTQLSSQVRRDMHKMRAFVRFRLVDQPGGGARYVAWFEPDHHIVRANAAFFINRFASQRWSILTPQLCIDWDGETLSESPGADRSDAPSEDAAEDLWLRYYASIFNPARLKVGAMIKEMPRRYWKNLPEARMIPQLIAGAQARESDMVARGADLFPVQLPETLAEIEAGVAQCRRCAIGCNGTRAVVGEGPARSRLLIVGEQPGDCEEAQGRVFVGPAGQLLDRFLDRAGLDRGAIRLTNAVKHFKFTMQGKRRLHQNPSAQEIDHCRWWLDAERRLVQPELILALGASAGRALLRRTPSIARERGRPFVLGDGAAVILTAHPSYLLRLPDASRAAEEARFLADLSRARVLLDKSAYAAEQSRAAESTRILHK